MWIKNPEQPLRHYSNSEHHIYFLLIFHPFFLISEDKKRVFLKSMYLCLAVLKTIVEPIHLHPFHSCRFLMRKLMGYMLKYCRNHDQFLVCVILCRGKQKTPNVLQMLMFRLTMVIHRTVATDMERILTMIRKRMYGRHDTCWNTRTMSSHHLFPIIPTSIISDKSPYLQFISPYYMFPPFIFIITYIACVLVPLVVP
jgi:hypothetical protein